jgi:hypothetical protein
VSSGPVHYELYVRRKPNAPWTLDCASEDRARLIETAQELLDERRAVAVRVSKEVMQADGGFHSFVVHTGGEPDPKGPVKAPRPRAGPPCAGPVDLYTAHAREKIARLLDGWLRREGVTAFELLHRPDLAEALEASGEDLQHALQKIAVPEAQHAGVSTHDMLRAFQKLSDAAIERVIRDGRRKSFPYVAADFAGVAAKYVDHPEGRYLLGGGVAEHLASAATWRAKVARLVDLAEQAPSVGRTRAFALAVLEQPLAEILGARGAVSDLVGAELDLGGAAAVLTRLAAAPECEALSRRDPAFGRLVPPITGDGERLARLLVLDAFENVRSAMARRVVDDLCGPRRLRPDDAEGEIELLRALALALTAAAGRLLPIEDVQAAFIERSKRLVAADFVEAHLAGCSTALGEAQALVRLAENVAGQINKRACARWLSAVLCSLRFEREMRGAPEPPTHRLAALASLQRTLNASHIAEPDLGVLSGRIGEVGGLVEADCGMAHALGRSPAPVIQRLTALLRLASGEAAPLGPAAERARAEALRMLRDPASRRELAGKAEGLQALRGLMGAAGLAAA